MPSEPALTPDSPRGPGRWADYATFLLLTLIWGTTWAAIRIGLRGVPPFTGVALRFAIAAALLFGLARAMRVPLGAANTAGRRWPVWRVWLVNALLTFCIPYGVLYWAEQWVPSGLAAVLFATSPLWVSLAAHLALPGERLRATTALGVLVGFAGVALIFSDDLRALGGARVAGAAAVLLISPFVSALGVVGVKRYGAGMHPLAITAVPVAFTALGMGGFALVTERGLPVHFDAAAVGALLYLGIFGTAVGFTLYFWLLGRLTATTMSLINYITPIVALAVGSAALGESFGPRILAGSALVVGGVAVAMGLRRRAPA